MKPIQIEKNVATIDKTFGLYRIVVSVEKLHAEAITKEEAEITLTQNILLMFSQRQSH
jgi:hypothetical protein